MINIFEAHATTLDHEVDIASGWNNVHWFLRDKMRAKELGKRYKLKKLDAGSSCWRRTTSLQNDSVSIPWHKEGKK